MRREMSVHDPYENVTSGQLGTVQVVVPAPPVSVTGMVTVVPFEFVAVI